MSNYFLVGATTLQSQQNAEKFVSLGIWTLLDYATLNPNTNAAKKALNLIKQIKPNDRIAIKKC